MKYIEFTRVPTLPSIVDAVRRDVGNAAIRRAFATQGLSPEHIYEPDAVLPLRDMIGLFERFARVRDDPMFGLFAARAIRPEAFGLFVTYALQAPDLRTAIDRVRRGTYLHQGGSTIALSTGRDTATWSYKVDLPLTIGRDHHGVHAIWQMKEFLAGFLGYPPDLVEVGVEAPDYGPPGALEAAFGAPVRWSCAANGLTFSSSLLDLPRKRKLRKGETISFLDLLHYVRSRPPLSNLAKTEVAMRFCLERGDTSIDAVARYLNTGARTMQRRLKDEGVAFRDVLERTRQVRAEELLADETLPLGRVALLLGYSDPSHFTRAYRRWHGYPPIQGRHALDAA